MNWLLLLHQIPPQPPYLRAKVLRRLTQVGALPIKNSAYLVPDNEEVVEDFNWIQREIGEGGGEAWVFRAEAVSGWEDEDIRQSFRALRSVDYTILGESATALLKEIQAQLAPDSQRDKEKNLAADFRKLKRRFDEVRRIDFFEAPERAEVERLMAQLDRLLHSKTHLIANRPAVDSVRGKTWVTRRGVKIDRMASAWFIRRFVDRNAQFLFFDSAAYIHSSDQIRFDMFEGEFTHENDMCTFEVLLHWRGVNDPALTALAEVVHDIDIKDGKFQRPEAAGVRSLIEGIALRTSDDMERIEESGVLFDSLYARFRAPK